MNFYFVKPKDEASHSKRWIVDDGGLVALENHYRNYPTKIEGVTCDRWDEFGYELRPLITIDFGGMYWIDEPEVKIICDQTTFNMKVSHLPYFIEALKLDKLMDKGMWWCSIWFFHHVYSDETRQIILDKAETLLQNCTEMIEGVERHKDNVFADINKDGVKIIRAKDLPSS